MSPISKHLKREDLRHEVVNALEYWRGDRAAGNAHDLLIVQELVRQGMSHRQAVNEVLKNLLETLAKDEPALAELLQMRYIDGKKMAVIARNLNVAPATAYRKRNRAIDLLAALLQIEEAHLQEVTLKKFEERIGYSHSGHLFGLDRPLARVLELVEKQKKGIVLLQGFGGIGKTTLAEAVVQRAIIGGLYDDFGWVSARSQVFKADGVIRDVAEAALTTEQLVTTLARQLLDDAVWVESITTEEKIFAKLQERLAAKPHLIVIDNLETIEDIEKLIPTFRSLTTGATLLLTSRVALQAEPGIVNFHVPALPLDDAMQLVLAEARSHRPDRFADAMPEQLHPVYEAVGGNPLALKLVAAQLQFHDLATIVESVKKARGKSIEAMYTYIYWQGWHQLDAYAQSVLLAMPLAPPQGGDADYLVEATALEPVQVYDALEALIKLNFVDRRGDISESKYTIHNLTRSFLEDQVIRW